MKRIEVLGCPMDVASMGETVEVIRSAVAVGGFTQHVVVNVAKLVNMRTDAQLKNSVHSCDIINIDGMGVVLGARFLGHDVPERVAGVDLFHELLVMSVSSGFSVFLLGAENDVVSAAATKVQALYPKLKVAGYHHGYFWKDEAAMVEKIRASGAQLLFVAITSPKKEKVPIPPPITGLKANPSVLSSSERSMVSYSSLNRCPKAEVLKTINITMR